VRIESSRLSPRWQGPAYLLLAISAVLAIYLPSLDLLLFADDYIAWSKVLSTIKEPWWRLFGYNYNPEFYRPFEHLLIRFNVWIAGFNPIPYRVATILGHLLMVAGVYWFARRFRFRFRSAIAAALIFGLSHANAMAVLSNDAANQIYSTLFGMIALGMLLRREDKRPLHQPAAIIGALWLMGALLWKDSGISYVPALAIVLSDEVRRCDRGERLRALVRLCWPFVAVLIVYFALRFNAGVSGPGWGKTGRYDLWPGMNVIVNTVLFLLGLFTPVGSSVIVLRMNDAAFLAAWGASLLVTAAIFGIGAYWRWRNQEQGRRQVVMLLALMFAVMLPDVRMAKISELYVYKPNVFFAILLGAGLVGVFHILWGRKKFILFTLLLIFSGVMIFSNGYSIQHKMHRLRDNGLLTKRLVGEIKRQMPELASRKILAVNRSPGPAPLYSIYYMEGVYVLGGGKVFEYLYGQKLEEFRYYKFEELDRGLQEIPGRKVVVLFRRNHIHLAVVDGDKNPFTFMAP